MKVKSESEVAQSCPTLIDPMDRSFPGSSVHGIFQARVLEWGAIAFSTTSSWFGLFEMQYFHTASRRTPTKLKQKLTLVTELWLPHSCISVYSLL